MCFICACVNLTTQIDLCLHEQKQMWLSEQKPTWFTPNRIQFYCRCLQTHSISFHPQCIVSSESNWSAFLKGVLLTLQSHNLNNGSNGGHQLGSRNLGFLPLTLWPTSVSLATVWALWLLLGCPKWRLLLPPTYTVPSHPIPLPISPISSISNIDVRKGQQKIPWNSAISDKEG